MRETPQSRYDAKNRVSVMLKLNRKTDADVLAWLDRQESKQGTVKRLIREEIGRERSVHEGALVPPVSEK